MPERLHPKASNVHSILSRANAAPNNRDVRYAAPGSAVVLGNISLHHGMPPGLPEIGAHHTNNRTPDVLQPPEQLGVLRVIAATVANGTTVELPFTDYLKRIRMRNDGPPKQAPNQPAQHAAYETLSDEAKAAVALAIRVRTAGIQTRMQVPNYRRMALKQDEQGTNTLRLVSLRPGVRRSISMYPDRAAHIARRNTTILSETVAAAEPVRDSYMVASYLGGSVAQTTFMDFEPNVFGPGPEAANAFWVSGTPRLVVDKTGNPAHMQPSLRRDVPDTPRWVVLPVRFYQVDAPSVGAPLSSNR